MLLFLLFLSEYLISGPKSYRAFRQTSPTSPPPSIDNVFVFVKNKQNKQKHDLSTLGEKFITMNAGN